MTSWSSSFGFSKALARARQAGEAGFGLAEILIALVVLSIGLIGMAGLSASVGREARLAGRQTDQALAAQQVLEGIHSSGYAAAVAGTDTVTIGNRKYIVVRRAQDVAPRVRQVQVTVTPPGGAHARTFTTRLYQARPLPSPPVAAP
ncbi:MAG: hypothetical protein ACE5HQ_05190 [Gemmatimonadota bacterium]